MSSTSSISRDEIARVAYERARSDGLAALSIRSIARECGVAVGTIYNYFPDKATLVTKVIELFWEGVAFGLPSCAVGSAERGGGPASPCRSCFAYEAGESLVGFCRRSYGELSRALSVFREGWLAEAAPLDARTRSRGHRAERSCFAHIHQSIERVIQGDAGIDPAVVERIGLSDLARFVWDSMYGSLREGSTDCEVLLALLERALYRQDAPAGQ
ncbi:TetR/AcrR family transcriptional regulator [Collinsella tanakaei]|uniref:TetR/AcrR family transcriptional regulator n=1 Tax=Collinsella tanakaei TaxID=626935 RepID=UPI0025A493BF|nr:TetR/AcrR family transcriptional regulator [Collinsella tanakaei]MDM8245619.1 TetR/AcrR family transcriptional regulator [Collinsella tanakaei]